MISETWVWSLRCCCFSLVTFDTMRDLIPGNDSFERLSSWGSASHYAALRRHASPQHVEHSFWVFSSFFTTIFDDESIYHFKALQVWKEMKSLLSQFTFLDCLRLSVKRVLEFSPFSPSPHPSNLGTEAQASTALAHGQAEALKKNKKTRENVCRDLKREETFCDSLDFTCNWKTTWGSFMACSAGCWDLYRSWWFSSRQG